MKQYEKYKASGIEWLGEIPEHWEIQRLKDISIVATGSRNTEDKLDDGKYPFFVRSQTVEYIDTYSFNGEAILTAGDGVGVAKVFHHYIGRFETHQRVYRISNFPKCHGRYLYYFLVENVYKEVLKYNVKSTVDSLRMPMFLHFPVLLPKKKEQLSIASYLDTKTAAIDRKIELLTAKADKYKALRRSLINETVCRGLNPNAPLKDSGIEWIGMIPEHWEVKRFKDIAYSITGLTYSPDDIVDEEDGVLVLRSGNIQNGKLEFNDNVFVNSIIGKNLFVRKGDILVCSRNGSANLVGKSAYIDKNYHYTWGAFMTVVRSKLGRFLFYALNSDLFKRNMGLFQTSTVNQLTSKMLDNMSFLVPSKEEQIEIVQYLDDKTTQIDTILTNINSQIGKLTQLRKTLINDVVTGKVKVTD